MLVVINKFRLTLLTELKKFFKLLFHLDFLIVVVVVN